MTWRDDMAWEKCPNCGREGFRVEEVREKGVLMKRYVLCLCPAGRELQEWWKKCPAWTGAPLRFFKL